MCVVAVTSSRVPSRPPAVSWHTHRESANQTLALDTWECQRAPPLPFRAATKIWIGRDSGVVVFPRASQTRSTIAAMAPLGVRDITMVALFGPANRSRLRSSAGSISMPRFLISSTPI
jgi:hypothetical protein